jgi:hypothetical protein
MKKFKIIIPAIILVAISGFIGINYVFAEKPTSGTPESNATSYIKTAYDSLVTLGYGSVAAGSWGDWGAYWNRIVSAAIWVPSGNATVSDVKSSKTFNNTTRASQTGTYPNPTSCSTQAYHDSYGNPVTQTTNCTNDITWTVPSPVVTGDDRQDPRTGLVWSQALVNTSGTPTFSATTNSGWTWDGSTTFTITAGSATAGATYTNNGQTFTVVTTISSGTSLNTTGTGLPSANGTLTYVAGGGANTSNLTFSAYTGTNAAVGNKTAKLLCSERGNGWRLPAQKELMQAYIDGSYFNLSQPSNYFWSATENSATSAWYVTLHAGATTYSVKTTSAYQVRCVR